MYHINPETNRPNICKTNGVKCSVATKAKHYSTLEEAKEAKSSAPKKAPAKKSTTAPVAEEKSPPVLEEPAAQDSVKTDIIDTLMTDALDESKTFPEPKSNNIFEKLSSEVTEGAEKISKGVSATADDFKKSTENFLKSDKVNTPLKKIQHAAADGFDKIESFGKTSLENLKGLFSKKK